MEKILTVLFFQIPLGIFSVDVSLKWFSFKGLLIFFSALSKDKALERVFDITKEDHLNIDLAEAVGVTHLAVSYPQVSIKLNIYKIFNKHMIEGYQLHVD